MSSKPNNSRKIQTTLRLPESLYRQAKRLVEKERRAGNLNDFFIAALRAYIKATERQNIDAMFALMADDSEYQDEASRIAEEFAASDAETLSHEE